ncbi:MAG: ribonuclease P protein component [Pseudomonadota bacterium]|nr:ribonuclease P protein component [Pseudomonadota bacterium]
MGGNTFPRAARLLTRAAFDEVFRAGQSAGSTFFRALVRASPTAGARLGINVPKRVLKMAHERNRVKRLLREAFRKQREQLPAIDLVLLARGAIGAADNTALRKDIAKIFSRAAALKLQPDAGKMLDPIASSVASNGSTLGGPPPPQALNHE